MVGDEDEGVDEEEDEEVWLRWRGGEQSGEHFIPLPPSGSCHRRARERVRVCMSCVVLILLFLAGRHIQYGGDDDGGGVCVC